MPQPKELDPYTNPRAFYGSELRRLREAAGLSQEQLGERVFCSGSYIGQFESANRRPQIDMSRVFDQLFGSGEHLERLCRLAGKSKVADYFADAAELEQRATAINEFAPMVIPGMLQTPVYARALTKSVQRYAPNDVVEQHVNTRMERAQLLTGSDQPLFWAILHEASLRVPLGGPVAMHDQLMHLVEMARTHPHIVLQVLPFSAGAHPFLNTMVSLMQFADAPPVVYTEGSYTGQLVDEPALVADFQSSYDLARAVALSPETSLALIESAAKEHAADEHRT
ncbi:helix-turn-helix transcriptional regulator [Streptomyces sp. NBC_00873]|uniref:helix-turn-helix domain-containing protein n=1 Tax=unclassified Streptomyces TaxID=2593676 RepID=UPI00386E3B74|nr:helix-turn-helix transcriptional regulator [Streptomyces sp. NBC_00873]WTA46927.1 helix-turn-helix transcriptional regulator [Streptomyces sp. NBC_00842]